MACFRITAKTWMFIMGLIFWAVAGGLFYLGGFIFYSHGHIDEIAESKFVLVPASILLLTGFLILIVGIIGIISVCTESRCLLATFFTILTLILALLVFACAFSIVFNKDDKLVHKIGDSWTEGFKRYSNSTEWKDEIDYVQSTLTCCGLIEAKDWLDMDLNPGWASKHNDSVPGSCCKTTKRTCPLPNAPQDAGCLTLVVKAFREKLKWIYMVAAGLAALLLTGMVATGVVMCTRGDGACICRSPTGAGGQDYETLNEEAAPRGGNGPGLRV